MGGDRGAGDQGDLIPPCPPLARRRPTLSRNAWAGDAAPDDDPARAVAALALRWRRARGPVMILADRFGGLVEARLVQLPPGTRATVESLAARLLESAYDVAGKAGTATGGRADAARQVTMAAVIASGAAGGAGGITTALAELPFTVTAILHAIRAEARRAGFDPDDPWIRAEALRTFGTGHPASEEGGIDTGFLSARLALSGPALQRLIATVAPKLAAALSQKLAAQSVPVLGALSGAALNAAFLGHYREAAAIRFALMRLAQAHGAGPVLAAFDAALATLTPRR